MRTTARKAGARQTHILRSPAMAPRLGFGGLNQNVRGNVGNSDHAPVRIEMDMLHEASVTAAGCRQAATSMPGRHDRAEGLSEPDLERGFRTGLG